MKLWQDIKELFWSMSIWPDPVRLKRTFAAVLEEQQRTIEAQAEVIRQRTIDKPHKQVALLADDILQGRLKAKLENATSATFQWLSELRDENEKLRQENAELRQTILRVRDEGQELYRRLQERNEEVIRLANLVTGAKT